MSAGRASVDRHGRTASRRRRRWPAIALTLLVIGGAASPGASSSDVFGRVPPFIVVRPHYGEGEFLARQILELRDGSPTFRDILRTIGTFPDVRVLVAPSPVALGSTGLAGRTTFGLDSNGMVASMQVFLNYRSPQASLATLAHEFAHVFEATCLADVETLPDLDTRLRQGAEPRRRPAAKRVFETTLAETIGREVTGELEDRKVRERWRPPLDVRHPVGRCAPRGYELAGVLR